MCLNWKIVINIHHKGFGAQLTDPLYLSSLCSSYSKAEKSGFLSIAFNLELHKGGGMPLNWLTDFSFCWVKLHSTYHSVLLE